MKFQENMGADKNGVAAVCIGVDAAREVVDAGAPVARGLHALEVQRLVGELRRSGVGVRIRPEFPWQLE
jgi:hypothetical protein